MRIQYSPQVSFRSVFSAFWALMTQITDIPCLLKICGKFFSFSVIHVACPSWASSWLNVAILAIVLWSIVWKCVRILHLY